MTYRAHGQVSFVMTVAHKALPVFWHTRGLDEVFLITYIRWDELGGGFPPGGFPPGDSVCGERKPLSGGCQ